QSIFGSELDEVVVRIHASQIHKSMLAPHHQWNFVAHRNLNRHGENAAMIVPVHVALNSESKTIHFDQHINARFNNDVIAIENIAHPLQILFTLWKVVVAVIGDEQRLELQLVDRHVGLKITVLSTANWNDNVV